MTEFSKGDAVYVSNPYEIEAVRWLTKEDVGIIKDIRENMSYKYNVRFDHGDSYQTRLFNEDELRPFCECGCDPIYHDIRKEYICPFCEI